MLNKIMTTAVLMAGATLALAQNAPPAGGAGGGQGAGRMDPAARFKELDKNNDGKLSLEEFSAMTAGRAGGAAAGGGGGGAGGAAAGAAGAPAAMSMADRFKAADTNKDGALTAEELTAYMQSMRGAGRSGGGTGGGGGMGGG